MISPARSLLLLTAPWTCSMLLVTLAVLTDTSSTLRAISWVAALCSTTAEAIVAAIELTSRMVPTMP